jgi:glutamate 5-kinase
LIRNSSGSEIGRGLVTYDAADAAKILGHSTKEIESLLGFRGPDEIIHRDDMALSGE